MNGFKKLWTAGVLVAGSVAGSGCHDYTYTDLVDPCWPQRYACMARNNVHTPLATQAGNGLALEQTVWNHHFANERDGKPTALLSAGGMAHLDYLARRRPSPMCEIFLQTAHDVDYDAEKPEQLLVQRTELDAARMKAITDYLAAARPDVGFRVAVHDAHPVGIHAMEAVNAVRHIYITGQGVTPAGSFGDDLPVYGIAGSGAQPTGTGAFGVAQAGATQINQSFAPATAAGGAPAGAGAQPPAGAPPR
jgi:hypothetical protein